ncbi:ferric-chelate reductase 1 [Brachionus plicatilis]|uniref:Ferric-chelate reductase 1 n=1 Tax=Brachionus plicatilis TaxID=10195 RepID=A0A3M7QPZ2_BRAPC|nr:ferric-chelate reductase 1 [Brachionus plicatilis]
MNQSFASIIFLFFLIKNSIVSQNDDCGTKYGCLKIPNDCQDLNCDYIVKWQDNGTYSHFVMQARPMQSSFYLAIGFSYDRKMGEDCVVMCKYSTSGRSSIEHYYNPRKEKTSEVLDPDNRSIGLTQSSVTIDDNFLTCSFKRLKSIENERDYFDLNEMYYLLMVKGYLDPDNEPINHKKNKFASSKEINFNFITKEENNSSLKYIKVHAILMTSIWMILATFGVIFARYFKFLNWYWSLFGTELWFAVHRAFMTLVPILTLIGFGAIFYAKDFEFIQPSLSLNFAHSSLGFITIAFSIIQPIYGVLRPSKNSENRTRFHWIHRIFGFLTILLAMASIVVGSVIFLNNEKMALFSAWIGWLATIVFLLEFANYKIKNKEKDEPLIETEDERSRSYHTLFDEKFKLLLLMTHAMASVIMIGLINLFINKQKLKPSVAIKWLSRYF